MSGWIRGQVHVVLADAQVVQDLPPLRVRHLHLVQQLLPVPVNRLAVKLRIGLLREFIFLCKGSDIVFEGDIQQLIALVGSLVDGTGSPCLLLYLRMPTFVLARTLNPGQCQTQTRLLPNRRHHLPLEYRLQLGLLTSNARCMLPLPKMIIDGTICIRQLQCDVSDRWHRMIRLYNRLFILSGLTLPDEVRICAHEQFR